MILITTVLLPWTDPPSYIPSTFLVFGFKTVHSYWERIVCVVSTTMMSWFMTEALRVFTDMLRGVGGKGGSALN